MNPSGLSPESNAIGNMPLAPPFAVGPRAESPLPAMSPTQASLSEADLSDAPTTRMIQPCVVEEAQKPTVPSKRTDRFVRGETSEIWGVKFDRVRMSDTLAAIDNMIADRTPRYVITANLNYVMLADAHHDMSKVSDDASLILADGQPIVWRSRIGIAGKLPERVTGSELIYRIAEMGAKRGWRIYFLGAEPGIAQQCAETLANAYPGLQVAGVQSPPYRILSDEEVAQQHQAIVDSNADILLVAFGQPKGERWIHEHYQKLGVPVSMQVGASFDFVAGTAKRAPQVWQSVGLEWAYRMFSDPARLLPRYASNAWFLFLSLARDWSEYVNRIYGHSLPTASPSSVPRNA